MTIRDVRALRTAGSRINQGDIFRNVECIESIYEKDGDFELKKIVFPLVIVLTQDCDLKLDYEYRLKYSVATTTQDKILVSVLVAPLYNADHLFSGDHLSELQMKMQFIKKSGTDGNNILNNEKPRYHYLQFHPDLQIQNSIIDFKHYFSVNVQYLKKIKGSSFVCRLDQLDRADVSHRFTAYLSRIALP